MRKIRRKSWRFSIKKPILIIIIIVLLFLIISKTYFRPTLMAYAKQKAYFYASMVINNAINDQVVPNIDTNKIINMETKSNGYVTSVVVDVHEVNLLIAKMTKQIQTELLDLQNDKNNELNNVKIPLGAMFDNPILSGIGPDIGVRLQLVGSAVTDVESSIKPYGINNSLIEVNIITKVRFQVMIPFQKGEIIVVTSTPLLIKVIQGSVPHYYYTGGSSINLPNQDSQSPNSSYLE